MEEYVYAPIVSIVFFILFIAVSRKKWDVVDTPTVSPSGAIVGLCEILGKAQPSHTPTGEPLPLHTSPISAQPCVWYCILVEKYVKKGKDSEWVTYRKDISAGGFRIADEYGSVFVDPVKAEQYLLQPVKQNTDSDKLALAEQYFSGNKKHHQDAAAQWTVSPDGNYMWHAGFSQWISSRYVSPDKLYYYDWTKQEWIPVSTLPSGEKSVSQEYQKESIFGMKEYRVTETVILPDSEIFAHGIVHMTDDGMDITIGKVKAYSDDFLLSSSGEGKVLKSLTWQKWISLIFWLGATLWFAIIVYRFLEDHDIVHTPSGKVSWQTYAIPIAVVMIVSVFGSAILTLLRTYNRFVRLKEQVNLSRSAIDVTLKRRSSLIPELCDVVEGIMQHEKSVLNSLVQIRGENSDLASKEIIALGEKYPTIHSSNNFLQLQNELGRTEEKIAMARSFLNDSILAMDNLRATLAGMILSPFFPKEVRPSE